MSKQVDLSTNQEEDSDDIVTGSFPRDYFFTQHVLKSKNVYQPKCLKRKLKKYKLRTNGKEDPDIVDISQELLSTLSIRSPLKRNCDTINNNFDDLQELWPRNYLFKMAKRKLKVKPDKITKVKQIEDPVEVNVSPATDSQEKKHTNAFKLLMDSRNKSIGSNSPGKEKIEDPSEKQELIEKKTMKVKRNLALQKLAEAKGSLKKKELEEYEEKCIIKKMEDRAERLKNMLVSPPPTNKKKFKKGDKKTEQNVPKPEKVLVIDDSEESKDGDDVKNIINPNGIKPSNKLQLINMFDEEKLSKSTEKRIAKEDKEFLNKLSPSIRKKENMLCYFKKIEKNSESVVIEKGDIEEPKSPIINVKSKAKSVKINKLDSPIIKIKNKIKNLENESVEIEEPNSSILKVKNKTKNIETENVDIKEPYSPTIKVRIKAKIKKNKHKRLSLRKVSSDVVLKDHNENNSTKSETKNTEDVTEIVNNEKELTINTERRKRKRKEETETLTAENTIAPDSTEPLHTEPIKTEEGRPKRNVKRPVKYNDDFQLDSSDEEIFSCKKRKHVENGVTRKSKTNTTNDIVISDDEELSRLSKKTNKSVDKDAKSTKKPTKLAPIFATKPQLNPAELEAKQKFLYSGIPEQLKKVIEQQKTVNVEFIETFPVVFHIQQKHDNNLEYTNPVLPVLEETVSDSDEINSENDLDSIIGKLINMQSNMNEEIVPKHESDIQKILRNLKESYPKFPVYRTYRLLRSIKKGDFKEVDLEESIETPNEAYVSNDSPENLTWTDKYKATSSKHLLGNFDAVKELKNWLVPWTERPQTKKNGSDSSDFYDSDTNSRDSMKGMSNLLMLTGPVGSGKTSCVYAVAKELSIKVIEVNSSSKRTGKIMMQDLQEATQSHKVNRATSSGENSNSQKSQDVEDRLVLKTKRGRKKKVVEELKKTCSTESNEMSTCQDSRTALSLILIDDADIIFEQDDGFTAAITQLVQFSKRPVILTCATLTCPHLQRFYYCGNVLRMQPLLPRILGTWLDVVCLADNGICWPGLGAKILDHFKGDIRKTINNLQFFMASHKSYENVDSQNTDCRDIEDENSNMSWPEQEGDNQTKSDTDSDLAYNYFLGKKLRLHDHHQPMDLLDVWWSLPSLNNIKNTESTGETQSNITELEAISNLIDTISISDHICHTESRLNITSQPWFSGTEDSVSELENFDNYDRSIEVRRNIVQDLVRSTFNQTQRVLKTEVTTFQSPDMAAQRDKDRRISRHENFTSFVNPSSTLDRRALALDYWSSCREICRIEKGKFDTVSKRHNRYLHYLKSLNALCKNDSFNRLGDSLI